MTKTGAEAAITKNAISHTPSEFFLSWLLSVGSAASAAPATGIVVSVLFTTPPVLVL